MKPWSNRTLIVAGAVLALGGGMLAFKFYHLHPGNFEVTLWREVIIFSFMTAAGLAMLIAGIHQSLPR